MRFNCHVIGCQKLLHSQCGASGHIVMEEPVVRVPLCGMFPLHVLPQPPQDGVLTNNCLSAKETHQYRLDVASHLTSFLWSQQSGRPINPSSITSNDPRKKFWVFDVDLKLPTDFHAIMLLIIAQPLCHKLGSNSPRVQFVR